jgi:hypothetical protein
MNLSLSNLAWNNDTTDIVLPLLKERGITQIEGVLTKLGDWDILTDEILTTFKTKLDVNGIKMKSIQSIFYNLKLVKKFKIYSFLFISFTNYWVP